MNLTRAIGPFLLGLLGAVACGGSHDTSGSTTAAGTSAASTSSTGQTGAGASSSSGTGTGTSGGATSSSTSGATGLSSGTSTAGTTGGTTGSFVIAPHHLLPQVPNAGGPTITQPAIVTVSYTGYPYDVAGYASALAQSTWLNEVGADYGVGSGQVLSSIVLDGGPTGGPATITNAQIISELKSLIQSGQSPSPTADTIYVFVVPQRTVISAYGVKSCTNFSGYHDSFAWDAQTNVVYAVVATCPPGTGSDLTTEDKVHSAISHEVIESATDPIWQTQRTYAILDANTSWAFGHIEVADLCQLSPLYREADGGLVAVRVWSNTAAAQGVTSPCVPIPSDEIYYNVSIDPDATVVVGTDSANNQTVTYTVTGWSSAPTPDWKLQAGAGVAWTIAPASLDLLLNGSSLPISMNNGVNATLTVTVPRGTASGNYAGIELDSYDGANSGDFLGSFAMAAVYVQ